MTGDDLGFRSTVRRRHTPLERVFDATLEREGEIAIARDLLMAARAGVGQTALIEGPSGIGKSRLLEEAEAYALREGMTVLRAAGSELEREYPFGVAVTLLDPLLRAGSSDPAQPLTRGRAGLAAPLFEPGGAARRPLAPTDEFALVHGLYWCLVNLSESAPLAVVVDDVHWADDLSLRFLSYLTQRLRDLPLALLMAVRTDEPASSRPHVAHLLQSTADAPRIQLREFTADAVRTLVARADARAAARAAVVDAAWESTRGNPFLVRELIAAVENDEGWSAVTSAAVRRFAPHSVARSVLLRLTRHGPDALALARAAAVLGDDVPLVTVAALAEVGVETAAVIGRQLMTAQLWASSDPVRYTHPLTRAAIYMEFPAEALPSAHERAAWLLRQEGASADAVAEHLLLAPPSSEPWVRTALHEGGQLAARKGSPTKALGYLRKALQMRSPDERADALLIDLGLVEAAAGVSTSIERFVEVLPHIHEPAARADALYALGQTLFRYGRHADAADAFQQGVALFADQDVDTGLMFESAFMCSAHYLSGLHGDARKRLEELGDGILRRGDSSPAARAALAVLSLYKASGSAPASTAVTLARRALDGGVPVPGQAGDSLTGNLSMIALVWAGRPEEALDHAEAALTEARASGSVLAFADASFVRAMAMHRLGRLTDAMVEAEAAVEGTRRGWRTTAPAPHSLLADCLLERGDTDGAEQTLEEARAFLAGSESNGPNSWFYWVRGKSRYRAGDYTGALDDHLRAGRILTAFGMISPGIIAWRLSAASAASRLGNADLAERLVGEELKLADEFQLPVQRAVALRLRAALEDDGTALTTLLVAAGELEQRAAPLEQARVLVQLGELYVRRGEPVEARAVLRDAVDLAHQCGATVLEQHAYAQLLSSGARPRRVRTSGFDALTPSERRIVDLAASQDHTNRSIAEALFLTKNTVEWHLRNAYRKLGVMSREELRELHRSRFISPRDDQA